MKLTDKAIRAAKPKEKAYKMADGKGLYLLVMPTGGKSWNIKYRYQGKERRLGLGLYPEITLADARAGLEACRRSLAQKEDPSKAKKAKRGEGLSFENIAEEWLAKKKPAWTESTYARTKSRLKRFVYPKIGNDSLDAIDSADILEMLQPIEVAGSLEQAHRVQQHVSQIYRYAVASRKASRNPATDLRGALTPVTKQSFAHLDATDLPGFLSELRDYTGSEQVQLATLFLLHTFVRTAEMRGATWQEISFSDRLWRIPKERMKMRRPHLVPLSKQTVAILQRMKDLSEGADIVFTHPHRPDRGLSENAILGAIERMGFKGKTTGHGFRSTASTILHENGFATDVVERRLAHIQKGVRGIYNHAEYLPERQKMMQWWSDYLDSRRPA